MTLALNWHTSPCQFRFVHIMQEASLTWGTHRLPRPPWAGARGSHLTLSLCFVTCPVGCLCRSPLTSGCLEVSSVSIAECGPQGCHVGLSLQTPESLWCMGSPEVMSACSKYPFFNGPADRSSVTTSYALGFAVWSLLLLGGRKTWMKPSSLWMAY